MKACAICCVFCLIGISIIQASNQRTKESSQDKILVHSQYPSRSDRNSTEKRELNEFQRCNKLIWSNDSLLDVIECLGKRYPLLDELAKEMGLTKQKTYQIAKTMRNTFVFQVLFSQIEKMIT